MFHEVKLAVNPELRAAPGRTPAVVEQMARYQAALSREAQGLEAAYPAVCRALVRLNALRRRVRAARGLTEPPALDPLVAAGTRRLRIDPRPRLIVFGFDADQREGALGRTQARLSAEYGLPVYAVGRPGAGTAAFRPCSRPPPGTTTRGLEQARRGRAATSWQSKIPGLT